MAITVDEFSPLDPVLKVRDKELTFKIMSLKLTQKLTKDFCRAEEIYSLISKEPTKLFEVAWLFLENKKEVSSFDKFQELLLSSDKIEKTAQELYSVVNECIMLSMPIIRNPEKLAQLNKIKNIASNSEPCYVSYYDNVAGRYSYTIDQFMNLSLRQLYCLLTTINEKKYEELEVQAALLGKKLKPKAQYEDISKEDDEKLDKEALEVVARLKAEYEKRKKEK